MTAQTLANRRQAESFVFVLRTAATALASVVAGLPVAGAVIWVWQTPVGQGTSFVFSTLGLSAIVNVLCFTHLRSWFERRLRGALLATCTGPEGTRRVQVEEMQHRQDAEGSAIAGQPTRPQPQNPVAAMAVTSRLQEQIGTSAALHKALAPIDRAAPTDTSILITGETGIGKESIARAIHACSPRRDGPFITVNCSALPSDLADGELFGDDGNALAHLPEATWGKVALAHGGTLFLDEVAELPRQAQAKLARVMEAREVQGGVWKPSFRVVATSNRDLQAEMRAGRFRKDLYYRVAVVVVHVLPLRQRPEDIPSLAAVSLRHAAMTDHKSISGFTVDALTVLSRYSWPGNMRELRCVIERAALLCSADMIQAEHLGDLAADGARGTPRHPLGSTLRERKLRSIEQALAQTGGNHAAAARLLGLSPTNLARLIRNFGVKPPPLLQ